MKKILKGKVETKTLGDGAQIISFRYKDAAAPTNDILISHDETWLHLTTDDHEGAAMINIECLPAIRRALARIAKQIKLEKSV